jgi:hypothetical protein
MSAVLNPNSGKLPLGTVALAGDRSDLLSALRRMDGRGTVGDVVAETGLPRNDVEGGLKGLLETHQGHLDVSDSGELLYSFHPKFIERGTEPVLERVKRAAWSLFQKGFKVWITVMLVVYFVVFVALVIAAILASNRGDSRRGGLGGLGRRGHGHRPHGLGNFFLWYWIMGGPRWRLGRPYYGRRWERTLDKESRVPFYKKVFAFVFGPDEPKPTLQQKDRSLLRLIRARKGVLAAGELVEHTALPLPEAEEEMGRLMGSYAGEPAVTPVGEVVYAFPELMTSARGKVKVREPNPAWMRLEYPRELTGNDRGSNAIIVGLNGFNLVAGATAPFFIFPRLGMSGPAAFIGLVVIPVIFSAMFFGVPLLRWFGLKRENARRARRNVRRLVLALVHQRSLGSVQWISAPEAVTYVQNRMKDSPPASRIIESVLHEVAAEFDADVEVDDAEVQRFRFPNVRKAFVASELVRNRLKLEEREIGDIVFSSEDDSIGESERELAAFDRELAAAEVDLSGYLPSPDEVGFEDDYEIVAFDDALTSTGA